MPLKPGRPFHSCGPNCYVVGVQHVHQEELDRFLRDEDYEGWTTDACEASEILPEVAGRVCYMSFGRGRDHPSYIANIKRDRHGSVLEHAVCSFILTGVSRTFTHECVRHRSGWSYSQLSQRYVDESVGQVVIPAAVERMRTAARPIFDLWSAAVARSHAAYVELCAALEAQVAPGGVGLPRKEATAALKEIRGASRSVLPGCTETKIFCTVNARALRHFLEMRASVHADAEIRSVAMLIYRSVRPWMPELLGDYLVRVADDGSESLETQHTKV